MLADYCGSSRELERRDISCLLSDYPDYAPIDLFVDYYVLVHLSLSLSLSRIFVSSDDRIGDDDGDDGDAGVRPALDWAGWRAGWLAGWGDGPLAARFF